MAVVAPAGTVMLIGTVAAAVLEVVSVTVAPPAGAGSPSITVAVTVAPPVTLLGLSETDVSDGGWTVSAADFVTSRRVAVIVTDAFAATGLVLIANVAELCVAGTINVVGTDADTGSELEMLTSAPPAGAGPVSVRVPFDGTPPLTVVGERVSIESAGDET